MKKPSPPALSFSLSLLVLLIVTLCAVAPARAQCPGPTPQLAPEANQNPSYLQQCSGLDPGGGCPKPAAPNVLSVGVQEAIVTTIAPFPAETVWWRVYARDQNGFFQLHYEHLSSADAPYLTSQQIWLGAAGLPENTDVRFEVSFCDATECFCWSDPSGIATTTSFTGDAPAPIATGAQEIEDAFERANTEYRALGGDGLGPSAAWFDFSARIVDDGLGGTWGVAEIAASGIARREKIVANAHAYAEAWIRNDRTAGVSNPEEFNIDVFVRQEDFSVGMTPLTRAYFVKLVKENALWGGKPTLVLGKLHEDPDMPGMQKRTEFAADAVDLTGQSCYTPLLEDDTSLNLPTGIKRSKQVLLRIEVSDNLAGQPVIAGHAAWGCVSGGITDCTHVCQVGPLTDADGIVDKLDDLAGKIGVCSHHKTHYFERVKGGSTPNP